MGQTKEGAMKAKRTIIERYGEDFYSKNGKAVRNRFSFADHPDIAREAGRLGGLAGKGSKKPRMASDERS